MVSDLHYLELLVFADRAAQPCDQDAGVAAGGQASLDRYLHHLLDHDV